MTHEQRSLISKAKMLAERYREAVADLVAVIGEVDRLRLFAPAGCSSTFEFCCRELRLSEDDAYKLIRSARASGRNPEILSYLAEGALTPRAIAILAPVQGEPDFPALLDRAKGLPLRAVERIVAERKPDVTCHDQVRPLRAEGSADEPQVTVYRFSFSADETMKALLDRLREVLSRRFPKGRLEDLLGEIVPFYLDEHDPLRREPAQRRRTRNPDARRVPPAVRDEVWRRDGGRCAFIGDGRRCSETKWLELDHLIPWALGGRSDDPGNIRLLCRIHNQWEAERLFGFRGGP